MKIIQAIILYCVLVQDGFSESTQPLLPDPLSLDYALSLATDKSHPDIITALSAKELARSEISQADSNLSLQIDFELEAAVIDPSSLAFNQNRDDHTAVLKVSKPLYDFGVTDNEQQAAAAEFKATKNTMDYVYNRRRLEIAGKFFAVILSDLKYSWETEAAATAFVSNDAVKDRYALGETSDVELLKSSHEQQAIFQQRAATESQQRITRAMLAEVLNVPGSLSSNLKMPHFKYYKKTLPEYNILLNRMMKKNSLIKLAEARTEAAHKRLQAARYQTRPKLSAQVKVSEYSRNSIANENWRAALNLSIPLLEHDGIKAEVSRQRSNWLKQRAMLLTTQSKLRQRLYQLWQNFQLLKSQRKQLKRSMDYRELNLDRSRALYEMEVKTDLGDAMVATSEVRYKQAVADFNLALTWMEILVLLNEDLTKKDLLEMPLTTSEALN